MVNFINLEKTTMQNNIQLSIAKITDIEAVLELQGKYLVANLTPQEKVRGFVTTPFTLSQLTTVIEQKGLFLAKKNDQLIAYCFAASWQYFSQWPIFTHMIELFPQWSFNNMEINVKNSFQYGPICIDIPFRGQGLINVLVEFMRKNMVDRYPLAVTFINEINIPSFNAHTKKLPWQVINTFSYNQNNYFVLALDMSETITLEN